jgi:hypothetical protein
MEQAAELVGLLQHATSKVCFQSPRARRPRPAAGLAAKRGTLTASRRRRRGAPTPDPAQVRKAAVDTVLGLTGDDDGKRLLVAAGAPARLARLVGDDDDGVAASAVRALVNLTDDAGVTAELLRARIVSKVMDAVRDPECAHRRDAVMLLANLTTSDEGAAAVLEDAPTTGGGGASGATPGQHLRRLVQALVATPDGGGRGRGGAGAPSGGGGAAAGGGGRAAGDPFEYAAHVLANLTRLEAARAILLEPERRILPALFPQLQSRSTVRRFGVASAIRNVCFETGDAATAYFLSPSVDLVTALLLPLAGPAGDYSPTDAAALPPRVTACGDDKAREPDPPTRRAVVESLLLLASARPARDHMRAVRVYTVVKSFHEWLESDANPARGLDDDGTLCPDDEAAVTAINKLVQQLYREDEVGPADPKDLRLDAPPVKATAPTVDLETAQAVARAVAHNTAGVTDDELASLVTPMMAVGWGPDDDGGGGGGGAAAGGAAPAAAGANGP